MPVQAHPWSFKLNRDGKTSCGRAKSREHWTPLKRIDYLVTASRLCFCYIIKCGGLQNHSQDSRENQQAGAAH